MSEVLEKCPENKDVISFSDKLKGFVGIGLYSGIYHMGQVFFLYLLYDALYLRNQYTFAFLVASYTYQMLFAKRNETFINFFRKFPPWKYTHMTEIVEEEPKDEGCMFPHHPHSIYCLPIHMNQINEDSVFSRRKVVPLGAAPIFLSTPVGLLPKYMGFDKVNPQNFKKLLTQKRNFSFIPGGFEEATLTHNKDYRIILHSRRGFIKFGLQHGSTIHPTFIFNEHKVFKTTDILLKFRLMLNKYKIPGVFYLNEFGFIPKPNHKIQTVVGKGIKLPKIEQPTKDDVAKYHELYVNELKALFNRHVDNLDPGAKLIIWDEPKAKL